MIPKFLHALEHVSIDSWLRVEPEELLLDARLTANLDPRTAGARTIKYARADGATSYNDIGFRTFVAAPWKGDVPLQTMRRTRMQRQRNERHHNTGLLFEDIRLQQRHLKHRALDLPESSFQASFGFEPGVFFFPHSRNKDGTDKTTWSYSLWSPPPFLLDHAVDSDVQQIGAHEFTAQLPGARWLPLGRLINAGRFLRMQEWTDELMCDTTPEHYYCFISHRWLTPTHPDPEGLQARFTAWQLVGYLCEAVHVAYERGLRRPRRVNPVFGRPIGPAGTELAESLLINVLRVALQDDDLAQAAAEVRKIESLLDDYGVAAAAQDNGLHTLAGILSGSPVLHKLVDRIHLWYDYSCLPQPPRTDDEQALFHAGLNALNACQLLGRTAVLLDDAEDYLSRAWCTLEAVFADQIVAIDPLVGSHRTTAVGGRAEEYFHNLLQEQAHLVWRAILDTEVFRVQDGLQCMTRLGLAVTNLNDLPFIYERLRALRGPRKIHIDPSELVTGVLPLPVVDEDKTTVVMSKGGRLASQETKQVVASLDCSGCLWINQTWNAANAGELSSFMRLPGVASVADRHPESCRPCHAAIIASCEGEAVLMVRWLLDHRAELEQALSAIIDSVTWVSTDIAPVGHFVDCRLRTMAIDTPVWAIIAVGQRFEHCGVTARVTEALRYVQVAQFRVVVDESHDNVLSITPRHTGGDGGGTVDDKVQKIRVPTGGFPVHLGGLFREVLDEHLL